MIRQKQTLHRINLFWWSHFILYWLLVIDSIQTYFIYYSPTLIETNETIVILFQHSFWFFIAIRFGILCLIAISESYIDHILKNKKINRLLLTRIVLGGVWVLHVILIIYYYTTVLNNQFLLMFH